jgi:hypothetical protein
MRKLSMRVLGGGLMTLTANVRVVAAPSESVRCSVAVYVPRAA